MLSKHMRADKIYLLETGHVKIFKFQFSGVLGDCLTTVYES